MQFIDFGLAFWFLLSFINLIVEFLFFKLGIGKIKKNFNVLIFRSLLVIAFSLIYYFVSINFSNLGFALLIFWILITILFDFCTDSGFFGKTVGFYGKIKSLNRKRKIRSEIENYKTSTKYVIVEEAFIGYPALCAKYNNVILASVQIVENEGWLYDYSCVNMGKDFGEELYKLNSLESDLCRHLSSFSTKQFLKEVKKSHPKLRINKSWKD